MAQVASAMVAEEIIELRERFWNVLPITPVDDIDPLSGMGVGGAVGGVAGALVWVLYRSRR